jgi:hypothetical protein
MKFGRGMDYDLGKWGIMKLSDSKLYWFYPDGGNAERYPLRIKLRDLEGFGWIDTWSRTFYVYWATDLSFDQVCYDAYPRHSERANGN